MTRRREGQLLRMNATIQMEREKSRMREMGNMAKMEIPEMKNFVKDKDDER